MLNKFFPKTKNLYLNDRHEEADTQREDKRKIYDKRIFPLLEKNDFVIFAEPVNQILWDYYKKLGLAKIKPENIFISQNYLNYSSLTESVLKDDSLLKKIKEAKPELIVPYIETDNSFALSRKINAKIPRESNFTNWINNKSNYRNIIKELNFPIIPGFSVRSLAEAKKAFQELRNLGFNKTVLKKERSVAGFGVFVIKTLKELKERFNQNLLNEKSFLVEGFIPEIDFTSNMQYFVKPKEIIPVLISDQILAKDEVSYEGSIYPSRLNKNNFLLKKIKELSLSFCHYLQTKKCYGFVGIDYIITKDSKIYSTETNVRFNASTFSALTANYLFDNSDKIFWKSFGINKCYLPLKDLFNKGKDLFIYRKRQPGIFPLGIDLLENMGEGQFISIGNSLDEIINLEKKFKQKIKNEK